jgi:hypothetical protein
MKRSTSWAVYAAIILMLASWHSYNTYIGTFDCSDGYGHSPDLGTPECNNALKVRAEYRTEIVGRAFLFVLLLGGAGAGIGISAKAIDRRIFKEPPDRSDGP